MGTVLSEPHTGNLFSFLGGLWRGNAWTPLPLSGKPNPRPNPRPNPTQDVMTCIKAAGKEKDFPLMCQIHAIAFEGAKCETIIEINK